MSELRFSAARIKIRRAKKLIGDLQDEVSIFLTSSPVKVTSHIEIVDGKKVISGQLSANPAPESVVSSLGDIIHNLRTSLDLIASEMARLSGKSDKDVYFPFAKSAQDFDAAIKRKNFHRTGDKAVALIKSLEPWIGGKFLLRAIHDLDVQDKHQSIIPVPLSFSSPAFILHDSDGTWNPAIIGDHAAPSSDVKIVFPHDCALAGKELVPTLTELVEIFNGILDGFDAIFSSPGHSQEGFHRSKAPPY